MAFVVILSIILTSLFTVSKATCTFSQILQTQTWLDDDDRTVTFSASEMSGITVTIYSTTVAQWNCIDMQQNAYLLRGSTSVTFPGGNLDVYICMATVELNRTSVSYHLQSEKQADHGQQRVKLIDSQQSMSFCEVCTSPADLNDQDIKIMSSSGDPCAVDISSHILGCSACDSFCNPSQTTMGSSRTSSSQAITSQVSSFSDQTTKSAITDGATDEIIVLVTAVGIPLLLFLMTFFLGIIVICIKRNK